MKASQYIRDLAANGVHHFSTQDAIAAIGGNPPAVREQIRRLKQRGLVAEPARSFHVIVPPEYSRLGCLPAEQFIDPLMKFWEEPYYLGLLSAAERFGAAHQRPQATQAMIQRSRPPIICGRVEVVFIARQNTDQLPVSILNTPRGTVRYSTPELTTLELVGYTGHAGGISNIATVLAELSENMDADVLCETAKLCPVSWAQRLGYLLEKAEASALADSLFSFVKTEARSYTPLRRAAKTTVVERVARWKLIVNTEVEPDE